MTTNHDPGRGLTVPIETLLVDLEYRLRTRTTVLDATSGDSWAEKRREDVAAIRGLTRAIRILRYEAARPDCEMCNDTHRVEETIGGRVYVDVCMACYRSQSR